MECRSTVQIAVKIAYYMVYAILFARKIAFENWPFLTVFGGDVTSAVERRVQFLFECNTKVTPK